MTQPAIATTIPVSLSTVNRAHISYHHPVINTLKPNTNHTHKRQNITITQKNPLLTPFTHTTTTTQFLNIHHLNTTYQNPIPHSTSHNTIYNLLHPHPSPKLIPHPYHPKPNLPTQNPFKKTPFLIL